MYRKKPLKYYFLVLSDVEKYQLRRAKAKLKIQRKN